MEGGTALVPDALVPDRGDDMLWTDLGLDGGEGINDGMAYERWAAHWLM